MKINRIVTISIFVLFLLSVVIFMIFGPQIRATLSPEVRYEYPIMKEVDGQLLNSLPASAVWQGEDGGTYVWKVSHSDAFPEPAFVVNACPIMVVLKRDGIVFFELGFDGLMSSDTVVVEWQGMLIEGMYVMLI